MEEAAKEALTARFRAYLDSIAETEGTECPEASDQPPDLFTLLAEVSTLRAEVRLESRQFKTALDEFRAVFDAVRDANARLDDEQERRREQERKASRESQKDQLLELLDLRDRLQAGYEQATRFRPGWLGGHRAAEFVKAMAEGMGMNLRRFDEVLGRRGVRPLPAIGKPFDPLTMHAAEVAKDPAQPEGRVVRELRKGFLLGDTLLRPAEVAVNRPAGDSADR